MAYLASELITRAYNLSGVVARGDQTVSGLQATDGLKLLNSFIAFKSIDDSLIPYYSVQTFNTVIAQETYFVEGLLSLETLTFNNSTVRFPSTKQSRINYFGSGRANGLQNMPFNFYVGRIKGGSQIRFYPIPNAVYPITITGKFALTEIASLDTDLEDQFDHYYIEYLRFALADYICTENNISMPPQAAKKLLSMENNLVNLEPPDLTQSRLSMFQNNTTYNWAFINYSNGWWPS